MINEFRGKYRFLSNFYPAKVEYDGIEYPSVEHAYQAAKTSNPWIRRNIASMEKPGDVKRYSRSYESKPDWEDVKGGVMYDLLQQKFDQEPLRRMLLDTGNEQLIEGNHWHDKYWGKCFCDNCDGQGENLLGVLLTRVRSELKEV